MDFCAQIAEWAWSITLGIIKTHRNFGMFQKQAKKFKQTSLQGRPPFEIAFVLFIAKGGHAFRLTKIRSQKGVFGSLSSEIIFGYTDPFFMRFFAIILSSSTES